MNKLRLFLVPSIVLLLIAISIPTSYAAPAAQPISGVSILPPNVQLFGHITLIESYTFPTFSGYVVVVELRDTPGRNVAILTSDPKFQNLVVAALTTGNLISFVGQKNSLNPLPPRGSSWNMDTYVIDQLALFNYQ